VLTRLAVGLLWLRFPPFLAPSGRARRLAYAAEPQRRESAFNLARCFPSSRASVALAKRHFAALGRSIVGRGILLVIARIARLVRPSAQTTSREKPVCSPHSRLTPARRGCRWNRRP
jgi:lauroyl/myristoyl acyltransferase